MSPKRFLFASIGSYGDLHPVLGIALELKARGHHATLASIDVYKEKILRHGLDFIEIKPGLKELGPETDWAPRAMHPIRGPEFVLREIGFRYMRENYFLLLEEAKRADVLTSQLLTFSIPLLAEKLGKPWASMILQPTLFYSHHDPPIVEAYEWLKFFQKSRWLFELVAKAVRFSIKPWIKPWVEFRRELGLPATNQNPIFEGQYSPHLTLALFSETFARRQPDWPREALVTGFPLFDVDTNENLSRELEAFLGNGAPPIVFTLGTAAVMKAEDFYRVAARVALSLRKRAVLLVGRDARNREGLPSDPDIFVTEYEPFSKLFPRAAINVHQGGVGTTAQALTSGRPQIIVPFSHDQPDNAERARKLGVSLTLRRKAMSEQALRTAIERILSEPSFDTNAREVAAKLSEENGIRVAADALESLASRA